MSLKSKLALLSVAPFVAVSAHADAVDDVTAAITANMADATSIVVLAGTALIALSFLGFVLRKGRRASTGRI